MPFHISGERSKKRKTMKTIIITGGSKGLGKEIVDLYLKDEWNVIELSRSGNGHSHIQLDLSKTESVSKCIEDILESLSKSSIDEFIYINNAATLSPISNFTKIADEDIVDSLNVNIISPMMIMRRIIESFRDHKIKKTLINVSSGAAKKGYSGWSLYCTGKAGIENFMNSLTEEEKHEEYPFSILNIDPYIMDTSMQEEIRNSTKKDFPSLERFRSFKIENELMQPQEVAKIIMELLKREHLNESRYEVKKLAKRH